VGCGAVSRDTEPGGTCGGAGGGIIADAQFLGMAMNGAYISMKPCEALLLDNRKVPFNTDRSNDHIQSSGYKYLCPFPIARVRSSSYTFSAYYLCSASSCILCFVFHKSF
jgi:hypothetical protein